MKKLVFVLLIISSHLILSAEWKFADANNSFAADLYKITVENDNYIYSPYSITSALAMAYSGMNTETKHQTARVLYFPGNDELLFTAIQKNTNLLSKIENKPYLQDTDRTKFNVANSLWIENSFNLKKQFITLNKTYFGSSLYQLDFIHQPVESADKINKWVEHKTNNLIKNIIQPTDITPDTKLILCNAVYFKANWRNKFNKLFTKEAQFYRNNDSETKCQMMHRLDYISYKKTSDYQIIELPYLENKFSMFVVLPKSHQKLANLEKKLEGDYLSEIFSELESTYVDMKLPKFQIETSLNLTQSLQDLGMELAFTSSADFTGINQEIPLRISKVLHKAFIAVDEEGTEAAAATVISCEATSMREYPTPKEFIADHPFLFFVVDRAEQTVLFMGRIENPEFKEKK